LEPQGGLAYSIWDFRKNDRSKEKKNMKDREKQELGLERFRSIVDTYGTDPSKWPKEEKEASLRFMGGSTEAVEIVNQAADLDRLLNQIPTVEPSLSLQRAVAEIPIRNVSRPQQQEVFSLSNFFVRSVLWKSALAATLAVLLGFASGFATVETNVATEDQANWDDFSSLAFATDLDLELVP